MIRCGKKTVFFSFDFVSIAIGVEFASIFFFFYLSQLRERTLPRSSDACGVWMYFVDDFSSFWSVFKFVPSFAVMCEQNEIGWKNIRESNNRNGK